jgi:hypothetical protein
MIRKAVTASAGHCSRLGANRASGKVPGWGQLHPRAGPTHWISRDGARVLRGDVIDTADELQRGFIEAMARASSE